MQAMDRWDWILLGIAVYVAVVTLVRLMTGRRNKVIAHLRAQVEREQRRGGHAPADRAHQHGDEAA